MECTIQSSLAAKATSKSANMESMREDENEDEDVEMEEMPLYITGQDGLPLRIIRKEFRYDYVYPPTPIMQDLDEFGGDHDYDEYMLGCDDLDMVPFEG
jgi:hypothetical protein